MRLLVCATLLVLVIGASAKKERNKMLLGADDVDKKRAEMAEEDQDKSPSLVHTVKEAKKMVKDDKLELKELQEQARALKERLKDSKQLSKGEKKTLKQSFRATKKTLRAKKAQLKTLKSEVKILESEKQPPILSPVNQGKRGGKHRNKGGKKRKNKLELIGGEELKINNPESFGLQSEPSVDQPVLSKKQQRKMLKKMSRKADRKQHKKKNKKHGKKEITDMMVTEEKPRLRVGLAMNDEPATSHVKSGKKHRGKKGRRGHRLPCTMDTDCLNGAICFENRKGHKFCKGNGMDKTAGKKCHRSEQCARGLKCFVKNTNAVSGKHRKQKGICADPSTADLNKGTFMPFLTTSQ